MVQTLIGFLLRPGRPDHSHPVVVFEYSNLSSQLKVLLRLALPQVHPHAALLVGHLVEHDTVGGTDEIRCIQVLGDVGHEGRVF